MHALETGPPAAGTSAFEPGVGDGAIPRQPRVQCRRSPDSCGRIFAMVASVSFEATFLVVALTSGYRSPEIVWSSRSAQQSGWVANRHSPGGRGLLRHTVGDDDLIVLVTRLNP